ncbi:MAG: XrtA/PEP-CTERM system TPR-repeat protein PrsT [Pseudomonadota bacterium]
MKTKALSGSGTGRAMLVAAALALLLAGCGGDEQAVSIEDASKDIAEGRHVAATLRLKDILSRTPDSAAARELLGDTYLALGDAAAAEGEYQRILERDQNPNLRAKWLRSLLDGRKYKEVLRWLDGNTEVDLGIHGSVLRAAASYAATGNGEEPIKLVEAVLADGGADARARREALNLKIIILTQRDHRGLRETADLAIKESPQHFSTVLAAAGAYLELRDAAKSKEMFERAAQLVPENPFARLGISLSSIRLEDPKAARSQVEFLNATLHTTAVPDLVQAQIFWLEQDLEQAEFYARRFLSKLPDSPAGLRLLGYITSARELDLQAKENFETYLSLMPWDDTARIRLASTLGKLGSVAESVQVLVEGAALASASAALLQATGLALVRSGRQSEGMEMLLRAREADPENADLRLHVASAHLQLGEFEAVQDELSNFAGEGNTALGAKLIEGYMLQATKQLEAAEKLAAGLIAEFPTAPQAYIYAGSLAVVDEKRLDEALAQFNKSVELLETPRAYTLIGTTHLKQRAPDKAKTAYERALEIDDAHVPALEGMSIVAKAFRNNDAARAFLQKAVRLDPGRIGTRRKLVDLLLRTNDARSALPHAHDLVELNPSTTNRVLLGRAQAMAGRTDTALLTFSELTQEFPNEGEPWYYLARARESAGDDIGAARAWQESLTHLPNRLESRFRYVTTLARIGDFVEAKAQAKLLETRVPDNPNTWLVSGELYNQTEDFETALQKFQKSFELRKSPQAAIKVAGALARLDRLGEGLELLRAYIDEAPDSFDARMVYATTLANHGKVEEAHEVFQAMSKQFRNHVVLNGLAYTAIQLGKSVEAVEYARRARDLSPGDPSVLDTLGWALVATGQPALAVGHLERAVQSQPENGTFLFHLANALLKSGELEAGKKALQRAVASKRAFPERERAKLMLDAQ